jgi:hypothetical protein
MSDLQRLWRLSTCWAHILMPSLIEAYEAELLFLSVCIDTQTASQNAVVLVTMHQMI